MEEELSNLFRIVDRLKEKYIHHNKSFTLDGKLVGDIGEVLVAEQYGIKLSENNTHVHDGYVISNPDKKVQIKASFNQHYYFPKDLDCIPDHFIIVDILKTGEIEEVYNGKGRFIYDTLLSHLPKERKHNYKLSRNKLLELNETVLENDKIKRVVK